MNLCGVCSPRPTTSGDRHRWTVCAGCGLVTDTVWVDPEPVAIAPRAQPRQPFPARTRLVPSLRLRR